MTPVLVDSNVILDIAANDAASAAWSGATADPARQMIFSGGQGLGAEAAGRRDEIR